MKIINYYIITLFIFLLSTTLAYSKEFTYDNNGKEEEVEIILDELTEDDHEFDDSSFDSYTEAYFDEDWNRVSKDKAVYYRIAAFVDSIYRVTDFYISTGMIQGAGFFRTLEKEERVGHFRFYRPDGTLENEGEYINNEISGEWRFYDKKGRLSYTANYSHDLLDGEFIAYYPNGKTKRIDMYSQGKQIGGVCFNKRGKRIDYYDFYSEALYPSGQEGLLNDLEFLMLREFPKGKTIGTDRAIVYLKAKINKRGNVKNIKVVESTDNGFNKTAIKTVSKLKQFKPAMQNGKTTVSKFQITLNF